MGFDDQPHRKRRRLWVFLIPATILILVAAAGVFIAVTSNLQSAEAEAQARASASSHAARSLAASQSAEAARLSAVAAAKAETDKRNAAAAVEKVLKEAAAKDRSLMEQAGCKYGADYLYYGVPDGGTCPSRYKCLVMGVTTNEPSGCPRGISVRVSFLSASDVSVHSAVRMSGAIHPGEQARLEFTDPSGLGTWFRVDDMTCY